MRIRNIDNGRMKLTGSKNLKCVVVGDDGTGKTSMIASFATGSILGEHVPTVFEPFNVFDRHDNQLIPDNRAKLYGGTFTVIDTANQEIYDRQRVQHYIGCDVILVCYPVVSRQQADDIWARWLPEFDQYAPSVPILLVGTKADLRMDPETIEKHSIMSKQEGFTLAKKLGAQGYVECSAIERVGLEDVFEKAREIAKLGFIRGISKQLSRKRNSRNRATNILKYLMCARPLKEGSNIR